MCSNNQGVPTYEPVQVPWGNQNMSQAASFPAILKQNNGMEDGLMSFVGMVICKDGICTFGDSKPSLSTELGSCELDRNRGFIDKVFANQSYVIAVYGNNQYFDKDGRRYNIEDWLNENVAATESYVELLFNFSTLISKIQMNNDLNYCFLIGSKYHNEFFVQYANVQGGTVHFQHRMVSRRLYTGGTDYYVNRVNMIHLKLHHYDAIDEAAEVLKRDVKALIKEADKLSVYNPVGGPIKIIYWNK